jgi:FtsH-binding integral membrane protein
MSNHTVMLINAAILFIMGIIGYVMSGSPTALTASGVGLILFFFSFPVKNNNKTWTHIAVAFTALVAIMFYIMGFARQNTSIFVMAIITSIALVFYIMDFLRRKKERDMKGGEEKI